jgi:hypothetical protein
VVVVDLEVVIQVDKGTVQVERVVAVEVQVDTPALLLQLQVHLIQAAEAAEGHQATQLILQAVQVLSLLDTQILMQI